MLVLSRKCGQRVCINDAIEVTVLAVRGGSVRLGFSAPPDVHIRREEICERSDANQLPVFIPSSP
jgi:carbon storage regulator